MFGALDSDRPDVRLTERQSQILELLAAGLSTKQIAERLGVSDQTVKWHVARLMRLLSVENRPALIAASIRAGLLQ